MNLKSTQTANFFVKTLVKILIYQPVNCVFSSRFAANFICLRCFKGLVHTANFFVNKRVSLFKLASQIRRLGYIINPGSKLRLVRSLKKIVFLPMAAILSACSFGPVASPEVAHYFLQDPTPAVKHAVPKKHVSILVAPISSAPGYQTSAMHYVITPYQLQSFVKHAWVSPPAQLWQPIIESALQKAGVGVVVQTPSPVNTDYRLQITLNQFEQNFQKPQSVFQMNATAQLQNVHTGKVVGEKAFQVNVPAQTNTPYAGVLAANKAMAQMNQKITIFLMKKI